MVHHEEQGQTKAHLCIVPGPLPFSLFLGHDNGTDSHETLSPCSTPLWSTVAHVYCNLRASWEGAEGYQQRCRLRSDTRRINFVQVEQADTTEVK